MFCGTDINQKWRNQALRLLIGWSLTILFSYSIFSAGFVFLDNGKTSASAIHQQHAPEQPSDIPFDADSAPFETQGEKDLKDAIDDEWTVLHWSIDLNQWLRHHSDNLSFFQHARCVQNKQAISLFVLHHSWRSFLS